uniref:1-phosphatidylinositol phosphodiesterase-like n=1 Tax=Solea senegalensis TaxID=28829 RepID=UPI001CD9021D|nr:1-phosphatidylinositol phosphodiesterase-like [Solea senegalensis]
MNAIPDETLLSALSIPGTHESLSLHGGPLLKRQVWTLDTQLKLGIRYFDMHVGIWLFNQKHISVSDSHWLFGQKIHFDEALGIFVNFLNVHRSETVLVKVTLHGLYKRKVREFMMNLIEKYRNNIWMKLSVPNMQQARGKIVLLQSDTFSIGTNNHDSYFFENGKLINVEVKIRNIKSQLCGHYIVLTNSAASAYRSPNTRAQKVNKQIYSFVDQHKKSSTNQGCIGVLSMDFPSVELIKNIIEIKPCNCKHQLEQHLHLTSQHLGQTGTQLKHHLDQSQKQQIEQHLGQSWKEELRQHLHQTLASLGLILNQ